MVRLDLVLDDETAVKFRKAALEKWHYKKGALSNAFEEAIKEWLKNSSHTKITKESKNQPRRRFTG